MTMRLSDEEYAALKRRPKAMPAPLKEASVRFRNWPSMPDLGNQGAERHHIAERMNKTEAAYAEHLTALGVPWQFEAIKLRLADRTWYLPDFYLPARAEFREVKGFWRDDARVKFKVAAEMYPQWRFTAVKRVKGGFVEVP